MNNELISIIVPVYKVEKYLRKCIESIINQTYKNLEIILVDDGSPDNCGKICDEYAKLDKRIKVIHKENGGLSNARNAGLDIAKGDYIGFVDSDDYIEKTMYEELKKSIDKYNSDISVCTFYYKLKFFKLRVNKSTQEQLIKGKEKFINAKEENKYIRVNAWTKLYKRKIFDNIRYPEGKVFEDSYIIYDILDKAESVSFVPKALCNYRQRKNSISRNKNNKCLDHKDAINKCIKKITEKGYYDIADLERYRKVNVILKNAYKLGYTTINDNRYIKEKEELINTINELSNSKYLSIKQMNTIKEISNDIDDYYKRLRKKLNRSNSIKRLLYYK